MWVTAFFQNEGAPATGLTPSITITDLDTDIAEVSAAVMSEVGTGLYKYDFSAFEKVKRYFVLCDGGDTLLAPDRYATVDSCNTGEIQQILDDTDEIQGDVNLVLEDTNELQTDFTNGGRLDLLTDAIKERTDLLPDDPASGIIVTTAISTTESNIRGTDSDTLETIKTGTEAVNTVADAIRERTDNLPDDPASEATITTAVSTTGSNITAAVSDSESTITTAISDSESDVTTAISVSGTTIKTAISDSKTDITTVMSANRSTITTAISATGTTITTAVSDSESNIRGTESDTLGVLSSQIDANYSAIQSIQNNTTRRIDIPTRLVIPDAGEDDVTYRFILGLYDTTGDPEVPDATPTVQVENISGVERLTITDMIQFLEDDGVTGQDGQYYYDYSVSDSTVLENLVVRVKLIEGGVTTYHRRSTEVTEFEADLTEIQADVSAIKIKTDNLPTDTSTGLTGINTAVQGVQTTLDDSINGLETIKGAINTVNGVVDTIQLKTDKLPADPASESNVTGVRTKTDNLPVDTASEFTDLATGATSNVATITGLLSSATSGLTALKTLMDNIDNSTELAARFTEIKGSGWTTETLTQLDTLLDAIKTKMDNMSSDSNQQVLDLNIEIAGIRTKTDNLPTDTSLELAAIDTEISGVRTKTDKLPVDSAQELLDIGTEITGIRTKTDNMSDDSNQQILDLGTEITSIRAKTNNLPVDTTLELTAIDSEIAGIRTKTDNLPVDTAQELLEIDGQLALTRERTDRLPDEPVVQSDITDAVTATETNIIESQTTKTAEIILDQTIRADEIIQNQTDMATADAARDANIVAIKSILKTIDSYTQNLPTDANTFTNMLVTIQSMRNLVIDLPGIDDVSSPEEVQTMLTTLETSLGVITTALQTDVTFIKDIEGGRWRLVGTQMIFYKDDNTTEVARFNLFDENGGESASDTFERARV